VRSEPHRAADCLQDIADNIVRIERYTAGLDERDLEKDDLRHDAVERCLERICEAAVRLGDRAAELLPDHPWADIRGMGNRLRQAYDRMDASIVWNVVKERLPKLQADIAIAMARIPEGR